jgi:Putative Ig domain
MFVSRFAICMRARHVVPGLLAIVGLAGSFQVEAATSVTISGSPPTSVAAGQTYNFTPTTTDNDTNARRLWFGITNKPSWATFSQSTGRLYGTPGTANVGTTSNIIIKVSDGVTRARLPAFSIAVSNSVAQTLTISGTPPATVTAGSPYSFQPVAKDSSSATVTYTIAGKPVWATFNGTTGLLSGTPATTQTGTYGGVSITASDGTRSASLPAFSIAVTATATNGTATVSWVAPTQNSDGSALTNLAGYQIDYGTSATALSNTVKVANPSTASYTVSNLTSGTWYFAVQAYTNSGTQSGMSTVATKTIQ